MFFVLLQLNYFEESVSIFINSLFFYSLFSLLPFLVLIFSPIRFIVETFVLLVMFSFMDLYWANSLRFLALWFLISFFFYQNAVMWKNFPAWALICLRCLLSGNDGKRACHNVTRAPWISSTWQPAVFHIKGKPSGHNGNAEQVRLRSPRV